MGERAARLPLASMATDVDNMPKPILDTLFSPGPANDNRLHPSEITGVVFPSRDVVAVRELCVTKNLADSADISGCPSPSWNLLR